MVREKSNDEEVVLSEDLRQRLGEVADQLIPASDGMPAASAVGVATGQLDLVLESRPDLRAPLCRALSVEAQGPAEELLHLLQMSDPEAHDALVLTILGGYYLSEQVTDRLGYPGQHAVAVGADFYPPYVDEGLLDAVIERGPRYRAVPEDETLQMYPSVEQSASGPLPNGGEQPGTLD